MKNVFLMTILLSIVVMPVVGQDEIDLVPAEELADPDGNFTVIDDLSIYYIDVGEADAPVVMLLHGFGGSTFTWRDTIPPLVDAGYRVVAYDRPPFGLSEKSLDAGLSRMAQAERAIALMDALEVESAVLVGHSAGGGVISQVVTTYPDRVDGLVFVAGAVPIPLGDVESSDTEGDSPLGGLFEIASNIDPTNPNAVLLVRRVLTRDRFTDILATAYDDSFEVTDDIRDGYARILQVEGWEIGLLSLFTNPTEDMPFDVEAFTVNASQLPVMINWGLDDTWVPILRGEQLATLLEDADFRTYEGVGHMPMEEAADTFNDDLLNFLSSIYGG